MAESKEDKQPIDESENEKVGLKLHIQKTKIMASGPITPHVMGPLLVLYNFPYFPWQIDGETVETVADFILGGSKITADGDCSHEIKRCLILGRRAMTNLDNIKKQRHYFVNKGPSGQGYVFSSGHEWMQELDCKGS